MTFSITLIKIYPKWHDPRKNIKIKQRRINTIKTWILGTKMNFFVSSLPRKYL